MAAFFSFSDGTEVDEELRYSPSIAILIYLS